MQHPRRIFSIVAVVVTLALVGATAVVIDARRNTAALRAEVAELRREAERREPVGSDDGAGRAPRTEDAPGSNDGLGDGLAGLGSLLEGLGGGDAQGLSGLLDGLGGGLDSGLIQCLTATADASQPGTAQTTSAELDAQLRDIADAVAAQRELTFTDAPQPVLLPTGEFEQTLRGQFDKDYPAEQADADQRLLIALGAIPPGTDLRALQLEFLGGQVAGFYDPDTEEIVVRAGDTALDGTARVTVAHEYVHALSDQRLGLPQEVLEDRGGSDAAVAALSLIEGDATLASQRYAQTALGFFEQFQLLLSPGFADAQAQLQSAPHFLRRQLEFPYLTGLSFACELFAEGGWPAVDAAYHDLPTTSAQILDPQRYRAMEGATSTTPLDAPRDASWTSVTDDTLGAASLQWLFEAPGGDLARAIDAPATRALAWAGGLVKVWTDGPRTAVGLSLRQRDQTPDAQPSLCTTITDWYQAAFPTATGAPTQGTERLAADGAAQDAVVSCAGQDVKVGIAPDLATARQIVE